MSLKTIWSSITIVIALLSLTATSCVHELRFLPGIPSEFKTVCARYVDTEGFLRGRTLVFNTKGAARALRILPYSFKGRCAVGAQGPTQRIIVCLARSSPCYHDRTTNVWGDQLEQYFEKYPGSYRGECVGDCASHEDTCREQSSYSHEFEPNKIRSRRGSR